MNYKPSDTMNLVHEVKKLGWHFTYSKENISINRHNVTLSLYREVDPEAWREEYRKKQAAGVRFEYKDIRGNWHKDNSWKFDSNKEDYREVQEYPVTPKVAATGIEPTPPTPRAAERALWEAQREAGTNEVWQARNIYDHGPSNWADLNVYTEPQWASKAEYRVKPMKLTAKIIRRGVYKTSYYWEFTGTREEYRAECEKYGYAILSEIKEVVEKPKTVKYYFALYKSKQGDIRAVTSQNKAWIEALPDIRGYTIIGDIEEREVEA